MVHEFSIIGRLRLQKAKWSFCVVINGINLSATNLLSVDCMPWLHNAIFCDFLALLHFWCIICCQICCFRFVELLCEGTRNMRGKYKYTNSQLWFVHLTAKVYFSLFWIRFDFCRFLMSSLPSSPRSGFREEHGRLSRTRDGNRAYFWILLFIELLKIRSF